MGWLTAVWSADGRLRKTQTPGGIPAACEVLPFAPGESATSLEGVRLRLECARLRLLRGFEELLCLEGLHGVERLPHQIETVRKVLRHFRGRVLLADEVGLGKTIEACLLLREFALRGLATRVLILVPPALVPQWQEELSQKFGLSFAVAESPRTSFWAERDQVLASIALAKSRRHFDAVTACTWDLVIVDEAHHCKNRATRNWQLVNALRRRHLFLLTATPVQNDLIELYNLLTLLEPGHLRTESDFRRQYVRRGNPRDPRNRERLRALLNEVMIRNTRSLVSVDLPPRYAQTFAVAPQEEEARLYERLETYLRWRRPPDRPREEGGDEEGEGHGDGLFTPPAAPRVIAPPPRLPPLSRMQVNALLIAAGSHPAALLPAFERVAAEDPRALPLLEGARMPNGSAKERKLIELLRRNAKGKTLVFANLRATLGRLRQALSQAGIPFTVFSGEQSASEKEQAVTEFRADGPVMLCSEVGGEGYNLQFCNTLINFDLPWNPMRIEQRVGRIHRLGQKREVFVFNLCTAGSLEARILGLLHDKLRMFELVVGEIGSILGNLEGGDEFESLVLDLWLRSGDSAALDTGFVELGDALLQAQEEYVRAKELDEDLFGDEFE